MKSTKNKENKKSIGTYIRVALVTLFSLCLFCAIFVAIKYVSKVISLKNEAIAILDSKGEDIFYNSETSVVYDKNGEVMLYLKGEKDSYYIQSESIPYIVKETFIVSEDRNFEVHKGIDIRGILRATKALIENDGEITQGGSTITQQLARNVFLSFEVSVERKIKEMFIAMELEKRYDKDKILEFYINNIYFANGFYGIEAASKGYFGKSVNDLTISELVFLCAIPNNPTLYDPYTNMSNAIARRDLLLYELYEQNAIDMTLLSELMAEEIVLSPGETTKNNYVDTYIRYCATIELMENSGFILHYNFNSKEEEELYYKDYAEAYSYCNSLLFTGGYHIYTTIDLEKQDKIQSLVDTELSANTLKNDEGIYEFQASSVCIDNATGHVVAIIGGRTAEDFKGYTLNRAYQSHRQPGSAIKPILTYTPILAKGYSPDSIVVDEKVNGAPKNYPNTYSGAITLRRAVETSKNTIAWKLFNELTADKAFMYLKYMGFSKIVDTDYTDAAAIGGMTYGVSAKEMAAAYGAIANGGVYRQPTCILRIDDKYGEVFIGKTADEKKVYENNACLMMTDMLKGVLTSGTGRPYQVENAICAAKTGTTDNVYDKWMVGYSYYYTVSVWCGYDYPKTIEDEYGDAPGNLWRDIMTYLHEDKEKMDFPSYYDVQSPVNEATTEYTEEASSDEETSFYEEDTGSFEEESTEDYEEVTDDGGAGSFEEVTDDSGSYEEDTGSFEEITDDEGSGSYGEDIGT